VKPAEGFFPVDINWHYYDGQWTTVTPPPDATREMDFVQRWLAQIIDDISE
jgi:hypothetical protein